jgi:hypothetical protein
MYIYIYIYTRTRETISITRHISFICFPYCKYIRRRKRCDSVGGGVSHCYVRTAVIASLSSAAFARVANTNPSLSSPFVSRLTFSSSSYSDTSDRSRFHRGAFSYGPPRNRTVERCSRCLSLSLSLSLSLARARSGLRDSCLAAPRVSDKQRGISNCAGKLD